MNNMKYSLAIATLLLLSVPQLWAQSDSNVYNERVVVQTHYKPVVEENQKINVAPVITDTTPATPKTFTYDIQTRRLTSLYSPSRIKAARIIGEPATKLYNNYIKLGFGNYWSPLAEVYINSMRDPRKSGGIRATHHSSWGTIGTKGDGAIPSPTYYGMVPYAMTDVALFGKIITKNNLQLSADLGYQNDFNRYYGFSDSVLSTYQSMTRDSVGKRSDIGYNLLYLNMGVKNLNTDIHTLGYEANVHMEDLFASYNQNEFNLTIDGNIHYGFSMGKKNKGIAYLHLSYEGYAAQFNPTTLPIGASTSLLDALHQRDTNGSSALTSHDYLNIFRANPYLDFFLSGYMIHAGATVALDGFNHPSGGKVLVYPDVLVSKSFFRNLLGITLSATGDIDANSWNSIRTTNPYIAPNSPMRATSHYDFDGKIRVNFSKKINLTLLGQYSILNDDLSFRLDPNYQLKNVFTPIYDSLSRVKIVGNLTFVNDEMLRLELKGNYYLYYNKSRITIGEETYIPTLYYRPDFDAALAATVNFNDKFIGHAEFQALGRMAYNTTIDIDGNRTNEYLPWRYGLNLELEYRHNKALSFFVKADNLLFQRYYLWQNYPSYRALFIAGVTYTIH